MRYRSIDIICLPQNFGAERFVPYQGNKIFVNSQNAEEFTKADFGRDLLAERSASRDDDGFDMIRLREHIDRLDRDEFVSRFGEKVQVTPECHRVTTHINNRARDGANKRPHDLRCATGARRVQEHEGIVQVADAGEKNGDVGFFNSKSPRRLTGKFFRGDLSSGLDASMIEFDRGNFGLAEAHRQWKGEIAVAGI
jgi:hypothetical protein